MRKSFVLLTILGSLAAAIIFSAVAISRAAPPSPGASGYHVIKTIPVGGDGGWDYVYVDSGARRIYISRGTHVVVLDADTYAVVGDIPDTQGVHGVAVASDLGRGFTSNGRSNDVTIFDLKTLKSLGTVKTVAAARTPPRSTPRMALLLARYLWVASPNSPSPTARALSM